MSAKKLNPKSKTTFFVLGGAVDHHNGELYHQLCLFITPLLIDGFTQTRSRWNALIALVKSVTRQSKSSASFYVMTV